MCLVLRDHEWVRIEGEEATSDDSYTFQANNVDIDYLHIL
jgi:hypothetical protein